MARFFNLYSGSGGNSTYIGSNGKGIIIDAGRNAKQLLMQLESRDIDISKVTGIFITHEHSDHISALSVLLKKYNIPLYATAGTLTALNEMGAIPTNTVVSEMKIDVAVECGGMSVTAFKTSHDCRESCGYRITTSDERTIAVCTDLGEIDDNVLNGIMKSDFVMLESNHDIRMLQNGGYPYPLKMRILGKYGHLSNEACSKILPSLIKSGTTRIALAHLSKQNNYPYIAESYAKTSLENSGIEVGRDCILSVLEEKSTQGITVF